MKRKIFFALIFASAPPYNKSLRRVLSFFSQTKESMLFSFFMLFGFAPLETRYCTTVGSFVPNLQWTYKVFSRFIFSFEFSIKKSSNLTFSCFVILQYSSKLMFTLFGLWTSRIFKIFKSFLIIYKLFYIKDVLSIFYFPFRLLFWWDFYC